MNKQIRYTIVLLVNIALSSCHFMDTTGTEPSYIHINPFTLTTTAAQGSNSQKIVDAWVYVDQQSVGIFELPATIPILKTGVHILEIKPGVLNSGSMTLREQYPFYTTYTNNNFTLKQNSITNVTPSTTYDPLTYFYFQEDFESNGVKFIKTSTGNTQASITIDNTKADLFEGKGIGTVFLTDSLDTLLSLSSNPTTLPINLTPVFIELNYNTTNEFQVGMQANSSSGSYVRQGISTFYPTGGIWKKVYVEVTDFVNTYNTAQSFQLFLGAVRDTTQKRAELHFDNIKLISSK